VPNDLNTHLPADKLAENGKGFFQITRKESISTTPLSADYYKPTVSLKNENYSFGFIFGAKGADSLVVLKVIKSSPAEKAGFRINDIITEFNGQNIRYKSRPEAARKYLKKVAFTNNTFKILRNNSMQSITH
jgi:S1-C subfamily serine protease